MDLSLRTIVHNRYGLARGFSVRNDVTHLVGEFGLGSGGSSRPVFVKPNHQPPATSSRRCPVSDAPEPDYPVQCSQFARGYMGCDRRVEYCWQRRVLRGERATQVCTHQR